jgi:hypothetical protein
MERIDSTHSIWLFDAERMRFRRVPKGTDPLAPSPDTEWEPYFALDLDLETGAFTVALNEERTRLLRAWRDDSPVSAGDQAANHDQAANGDHGTKELRLEPLDEAQES